MRLLNLFIFVIVASLPLTGWAAYVNYALDVQIDTQKPQLKGTARITATEEQTITLAVPNLANLTVDDKTIIPEQEHITLTVQTGQEIVIRYETALENKTLHFVDQDNVFLTGNWYPQPNTLAKYALSVTLPNGFLAISEAEVISVQASTFTFKFDHPQDSLTLAASKDFVLKTDTYKKVAIETYFFSKDAHLADTYIEYARKYLAMYEAILTPYPYQRFAIVENILPTGQSMPTFTLLGKAIVHLPFIVKISLGHEILHQWFGNSVFVDYEQGNWAEGITNYLADQHYTVIEGKDVAYRKQIMVDYNAYVNANNATQVNEFKSRHNNAQRAIGYGKTAMIFHRLRKLYGDEIFFTVLRDFIKSNQFSVATWSDIQAGFEKATGDSLLGYFTQWVNNRNDIPHLTAEAVELQVIQGKLTLSFTIVQHTAPYHLLKLPLTIYTTKGKTQHLIEISAEKEKISLSLDEPPTRVVIDENYDIMRQLVPQEIPPTLALAMGRENIIVVMRAEQQELYQPLIDALAIDEIIVTTPSDLKFAQLKNNSVLIAGFDTSTVDMLFSQQIVPDAGVRVAVHKNPYNAKEVIGLLHAQNSAEVQAMAHKLSHYGKYSVLAFTDGKITHKAITKSEHGIPLLTRPTSQVVKPSNVTTLDAIIPELMDKRVIYIGEQHEKFAHHINQLMVIKRLHEADQKIAVGMEMFPLDAQKAIDDYMADRINEYTFLHQSDYFKNWAIDYNLYKPILDYLKSANIPLVALNIARPIADKVAQQGIYALSVEEKQQLPVEMDFSNIAYQQDLYQVFLIHQRLYGIKHFEYFLQAQTLWDETMAQSAQQFLTTNPDTKLIVLAGNGHLANQYGIPLRVSRHLSEPFTVIVQDEAINNGIADYVLFSQEIKGQQPPLLGVAIEEQDGQVIITTIGDNTPAKKANLQIADIITHLAGQEIHDLADLKLVLFYIKVNSTITIQLLRSGKKITREITLSEF